MQLHAEIVSADSRQVFRRLDIGTAKPTPTEQSIVPHHFIDILNPDQEYSAGMFGLDARRTLEDLAAQGKNAILVGGSGLYIRALLDGFFDGPSKHREVRAKLEERMRSEGPDVLLGELRLVDPEAAARMNTSNTRRIVRALEVHEVTGRSLSAHHRGQNQNRSIRCIQLALLWPRGELYQRIDHRAIAMLEAGLVDEAKELQALGYGPHLNALNTVGYKEVFAHLAGAITEDRMLKLIQQNSRRYAKRQMTWFRADERIHWIPVDHRTAPMAVFNKALELFEGHRDKSVDS
jgi:tRNA dimethylallyltransferase